MLVQNTNGNTSKIVFENDFQIQILRKHTSLFQTFFWMNLLFRTWSDRKTFIRKSKQKFVS